jgi:hypothetical protein
MLREMKELLEAEHAPTDEQRNMTLDALESIEEDIFHLKILWQQE